MDQTSSNLPAPLAIGIGVAVVLVLIVVGMNYLKKRSAAWTGKVVDKDIRYREPANQNNLNQNSGVTISSNQQIPEHYLKVETTEGKTVSLKVSDGIYGQFEIGDAIAKASGTMTPHKPAKQ